MSVASCDLNLVRNKGFNIITSTANKDNPNQLRYPSYHESDWNYLYTNMTSDFTIYCNESGNWVMTRSNTSCQGLPTMVNGSKFYYNDTNIAYISNQTGKVFNTSSFSQYTGTLTKAILENTNYFFTNGTKIEANCNSGYTEVDKNNKTSGETDYDTGGHYYECENGKWVARGGCKIPVTYMSPRNNTTTTKYFNNGEKITCTSSTFYNPDKDPDLGTKKVCKVNGYIVSHDGETFTIDVNTKQAKYCHGSTIPYDLSGNLNASFTITGWASGLKTKDTYKTTVTAVNGNITITDSNGGTSKAESSVICQEDGTWKLGSGYMSLDYNGETDYVFMIPHGSKKSNKSYTIELYGAQGGDTTYGGKGGYTKLVSQLGNKFNDGTKLYPVVGGKGSGPGSSYTGGHNGGGEGSHFHSNNKDGGGGGGATHIATASGLLSSLSGNKSAIIAVAGGGGGAGYSTGSLSGKVNGGAGGGSNSNGSNGYNTCFGWSGKTDSREVNLLGHSDNSACSNTSTPGNFGVGGRAYDSNCSSADHACGGGGGGYYGGGGAGRNCSTGYTESGGGGGSGYCNTSLGTCSGSNGQRSGNGYIKITW